MGQPNSRRISHDIDRLPNTFRDDQLRRILDDIDIELSGHGFSEVIRTGVFVDKIVVWDRPTNNPTPDPDAIKYAEITLSRTGPFVTSITKDYYSDDGATIIATTNCPVTRDGNNKIIYSDAENTRP